MKDESFTYTLHHVDGSKEVKIANLRDLHGFLSDRIDLEIHQINKYIEKRLEIHRTIYLSCATISITSLLISMLIIFIGF